MKKIKYIAILIYLTTGAVTLTNAQVKDAHPIDAQCTACLDSIQNQTTLGMVQCEQKAAAAWEAEMNRYCQLLVQVLNKTELIKFKKAQKLWLAYRKAETQFLNEIFNTQRGTLYHVFAAAKKSHIVKTRVLELIEYYNYLTDKE